MRSTLHTAMTLLAAVTLGLGGAARTAWAEFPDRPITIVVPWPAGTGPDIALRILAERMKDDVGVPVIVTNVVGGSGTKGFAHVKNMDSDGYTLLNTWVAPHTVAPLFNPDAGYVANEDFQPVGGFAFLPFVLLVPKDHPASNVAEFVQWAKQQNANGRTLKFGACAALSVPRMVMEEFVGQNGLTATAVPFSGCNADNAKSILDGSTDFAQSSIVWLTVLGKQTKALGIFTDERHPLTPDIPTFKEQGFDIGWGKVAMGWGGLAVNSGTPPERLKKLQSIFAKWLQDREFIDRSAKSNFAITYMPPDEFYDLWVYSEKVLSPPVERLLKAKGN